MEIHSKALPVEQHYQEFLKSRERAMANLNRFFMEEQIAQYHLMMYMRRRKPIFTDKPPAKSLSARPCTPFPEDM